ncbi:unnamed protein product [Paramecium sonneborni]|uniref:Uncharacterized protein n=1 Tax=Paramecium sonneborni TaxID=65129 RepID=A0A8S1RWJ1_9CILI|nr:unnamed protein product [Paramecium sonneborni]
MQKMFSKKTETKPQVVKQIDEEALKKISFLSIKENQIIINLQSELNTEAAKYLGFTNQVQEPKRENERRGERRQYDKQEPIQEQQQQSETQPQEEKEKDKIEAIDKIERQQYQ